MSLVSARGSVGSSLTRGQLSPGPRRTEGDSSTHCHQGIALASNVAICNTVLILMERMIEFNIRFSYAAIDDLYQKIACFSKSKSIHCIRLSTVMVLLFSFKAIDLKCVIDLDGAK